MYVTMCVFPRVINRLVLALEHFIERIRIDGRLVSQNHFDPSADIRIDNLAHRLGLRILRPNQSEIAVALPDADYNRHVTLCAPTALLACNIGFINLNRPIQRLRCYFQHGRPDTMAEVPCCFVADCKLALHLIRGHALAGFAEQIGRKKPLPEWKMRVMEDGFGGYTELVRAIIANKLIALQNAVNLARAAFETLDAIRPAEAF